jgi:hypothetical protein
MLLIAANTGTNGNLNNTQRKPLSNTSQINEAAKESKQPVLRINQSSGHNNKMNPPIRHQP